MRIFVASTYEDLLSYRAAATRSILTSGNISEDMLLWPAEESPPLEASIRRVKSCNLLILLIAHRYGEPPAGHDVSITELELNEAVALGLPILAFVVDPTYPWPPNQIEKDPAKRVRLEAFIQEVSKRVTCKRFTSPESLEVAIMQALTRFVTHPRALPSYVQARARRVSRLDSLYYSADSTIQIGRAPDGAPLLLSVTRHIRVEDDLAAIANRLGKKLRDRVFEEILAQLTQEARTFAATNGIYRSAVSGRSEKFYVPNEPLTHQVTPNLFQSMLGLGSGDIPMTHPNSALRNSLLPSFISDPPLNIPSVPTVNTGFSRPPFRPGIPDPGEHSMESGRPFDLSHLGLGDHESGEADNGVISVGGMNRFLCIALDSSPSTWSGGWAVYPSGLRKLIIGRPFIEEGLERLPGVDYVIQVPVTRRIEVPLIGGARRKMNLIKVGQSDLFIKKWTELLSSADDAELQQMSYKITIPRSSIARFTLEVIEEVSRLHERGKVHGDIKPSNILISRNDTLLIDDADLNIGDIAPTVTPGWSPCEQLLRKPLPAAADIFSLGVLLMHVLAAEPLGREVRYRMPGGQMALIFDDPTVYIEPGSPGAC